jgi:hypothetical protein
LPLFALPVFALPVFALPLFALPVFELAVFALPLFALPVFELPVFTLPVIALPVFAVPPAFVLDPVAVPGLPLSPTLSPVGREGGSFCIPPPGVGASIATRFCRKSFSPRATACAHLRPSENNHVR